MKKTTCKAVKQPGAYLFSTSPSRGRAKTGGGAGGGGGGGGGEEATYGA